MSGEENIESEVPEVDDSQSEMPDLPESQGAAPAAEPVAEQPSSPWDAFKQIPAFQGREEAEIAQHVMQSLQREQQLAQQLRQFQSFVPVASDYISNREMYERWKAQQQQPAPQAAPAAGQQQQEESWWNPPKVRDAYRQYLVKDEQGREVIDPNAPLDARHALAEYQSYKADFAKKFLENPEQTLMPMVAKVAEQRAQELIQQQLHRRDEESFVDQIERENADWLRDENGNVSREAVLAQKYVEDAKRYGIQGAKPRWEFARAMVERELLLDFYTRTSGQQQVPQVAAPPQPNPGDAIARQNMEFLRQQASRNPPRSSPATTDPRVPKPKSSFEEKLLAQMVQEGMFSN